MTYDESYPMESEVIPTDAAKETESKEDIVSRTVQAIEKLIAYHQHPKAEKKADINIDYSNADLDLPSEEELTKAGLTAGEFIDKVIYEFAMKSGVM